LRTIALLYHDVVPPGQDAASGFGGADADIYKLHVDEFESHLREIARAAPTAPVSGRDGAVAEEPRLLLTFDDGGVSAILYTAGLLEQFGWHGHFFITTDQIGKPGFLNDIQIRELHRRSHVIGSHSCTHPARMSRCTRKQLDYEWRESVQRLTQILGDPVSTASVPGGYYSRVVAESAAATGLRQLFTSEPVTSSHLVEGCAVVGRFSVQRGASPQWVGSIVSGNVLPRFQQYIFWNGKKLLKAVGGETWLAMRRKILARRAKSTE
jgi:peptidoglycan/xylan/chitin deacetylase (PgdA/CDA1 family)